jgi:hypothetical protein
MVARTMGWVCCCTDYGALFVMVMVMFDYVRQLAESRGSAFCAGVSHPLALVGKTV